MKKHMLLLVVVLVLPYAAWGQTGDILLNASQQPARVSFMALYQSYEGEGEQLSEISAPLLVFMPLGRTLGISLLASPASVSGSETESLSGFSDAQVALSHYRQVGSGSLVLSLGANLPSGRRELTLDEFGTSVLLSQSFFDFHVPVLGQGFNVSPGFTWAFPIGEGLALGIGAAYQYRGSFRPIKGTGMYEPGDEVLASGGIDVRLNPAWSLSADVAQAFYATDKVDGEEVFGSGGKTTITLQLLGRRRFDTARFVIRYRSKSKSELPAGLLPDSRTLQTVPNLAEAFASYRARIGRQTYLTFLAHGRSFGETDICGLAECTGWTTFDAGLAPELGLSDSMSLLLRGLYRVGSFSGPEVGMGLNITL